MDETMSGEPMALKVVNKVSGKSKIFYRKKFLTPGLPRMLCNALIQSYFHYVCPVWFPKLNVNCKSCKINV